MIRGAQFGRRWCLPHPGGFRTSIGVLAWFLWAAAQPAVGHAHPPAGSRLVGGLGRVAQVTVGAYPVTLGIDPAVGHAFVLTGRTDEGREDPGHVAMLDSATGRMLRDVPVGVDPQAIAIDTRSHRAFVTADGLVPGSGGGAHGGGVSVLDTVTGRVLRTIPDEEALAVAIDERANRAVVLNLADGDFLAHLLLDATSGAVLTAAKPLATMGVWDNPRNLVVDRATGRAFLLGHAMTGRGGPGSALLIVLDTHTGALMRTVGLPGLATGGLGGSLALDEAAATIVVAGLAKSGPPIRSGTVLLVDEGTMTIRASVGESLSCLSGYLGGEAGVVGIVAGGALVVSSEAGCPAHLRSTRTGSARRIPALGACAIPAVALGAAGFVAGVWGCAGGPTQARLVVCAAGTGAPLAHWDLSPERIQAVAWDATGKRIFVVQTTGLVTVLDSSHLPSQT